MRYAAADAILVDVLAGVINVLANPDCQIGAAHRATIAGVFRCQLQRDVATGKPKHPERIAFRYRLRDPDTRHFDGAFAFDGVVLDVVRGSYNEPPAAAEIQYDVEVRRRHDPAFLRLTAEVFSCAPKLVLDAQHSGSLLFML